MVINFATTDFDEPPVLVLKNLDGTTIQTLGYVKDVNLTVSYNDVSELTFTCPAMADGKDVPGYDSLVGMRIVDLVGYGQFVLMNPKESINGIYASKSCTAYSLEYEFTNKKISIENGTYLFWNPATPEDTIIYRILEKMPSWSIGSIDDELVGKYRTFEVSDENLYNFMKSTLQETYQCIFYFDVYARTLSVKSVSQTSTKPVFISCSNLAKGIELTEDTENIFTCLDVNGADGVYIRSVNPMGTNKIYNFDYFMTLDNFSQLIIDKYYEWKKNYEDNQLPYYNITVDQTLQIARKATEEAALTELNNELSALETQQAVYIEAIARGLDGNGSQAEGLKAVNADIRAKKEEIADKKDVIELVQTRIDDLTEQLQAINTRTSFNAFFTDEEVSLLDLYIKEDSIQDSTFVAPTVKTYNTADECTTISSETFRVEDSFVTLVEGYASKTLITMRGGRLHCSTDSTIIDASLGNACLDLAANKEFVFTACVGAGRSNSTSFASGCVSITGTYSLSDNDCSADSDLGSGYYEGTYVELNIASASFYFTQNTTEYQQRSIEWDLYEYGTSCLGKLAYPSYSFSISSANFFQLETFEKFAREIELGHKCYVSINEERTIEPIFIGFEISFDDKASLTLSFSSTYNSSDNSFNMADLLNQSVSMGKTVDLNKYTYSSFVESGASTSVKEFMESAFDVSKNAILSSSGQAVSWDSAGIRLRKYLDDTQLSYEDEQIWMINNNICFTDDAWDTAKMAIGKFHDENVGDCWGVVAPNIVGTLLAGSNLVIESVKKDGDVSVFKVDADGASLHNATFDIYNGTNTQITLNPVSGIAIGSYPLYSGDDYQINEDNAKFWVDTDGNVHLKGTLEGVNGTFSGELKAATGSFSGELKAATGSFSGDVYADSLYLRGGLFDANGNPMLDSDKKILADYLNVSGLTVYKTDEDGNLLNSAGQIVSSTSDALSTFQITNTGDIHMSGSITWDAAASPMKALYHRTSTTAPTGSYDSYPDSSSTSWHKVLNSTYDYYASYSYDGGATWVSPIQIQGRDGINGTNGQNGENGKDANVPAYIKSTYIDMTQVSSPALYGNRIYANGAFYIADLSVSSSGSVSVGTSYGRIGRGTGFDGSGTTTGVVLLTDSEHYIICTDAGVRMQAGVNSIYCTDSVIMASNGSKTVNLMNLNSGGGTAIAVFG